MLVLKFGGTSVGTPEAIEKIIKILKDEHHTAKRPADKVRVMVVSAFSGVTDTLIAMAREGGGGVEQLRTRHKNCASRFLHGSDFEAAVTEINDVCDELTRILESVTILGDLSLRTLDRIMSFGEFLCARLMTRILNAAGIAQKDGAVQFIDARELVKTDANYGGAHIDAGTEAEIQKHCAGKGAENTLFVTQGFVGAAPDGSTTTLGRGGSDLSAAVFGAALNARCVEIWTDVDGVLTCDPRMVKDAFTIERLSYTEAMELSHFGAKVLYPPTVLPALKKNIPIKILNTFNSEHPGTLISREDAPPPNHGAASAIQWQVRGISSMANITLLRIEGAGMTGVAGFAARLFGALSRAGINIILITQASSEYSICIAVQPEDGGKSKQAVCAEFEREITLGSIEEPVIEAERSIIAAVGSKMKSTAGISGTIFSSLGRNGINVIAIAQGSSEINTSLVIAKKDTAKALNCIHEAFFLSGVRSVNLYLVGMGLIGGTLLEQIAAQRETLAKMHKIRIKLVGIANSKKMLFNAEGIDAAEAKTLAANSPEAMPFTIAGFVETMKSANLPNAAFCDCTASEDVALSYAAILRASIPVITPNKKANSGALDYYREITGISRERAVPYLYEVTVCAGLPIISTLRDLHLAGDTIQRIEAVLSGTLSFIFNSFDGSKTFSALVREANAKGYTEPDPRDDLNAMDAARKALILARECGMALELSDVEIEPILPAACFKAKTLDDFWAELEKCDADFEARRKAAQAEGKALRYVAVVEAGLARIALRAESPESPFRSLVDADNIVVITSSRYVKLPMVIKGPGAGAAVTAGGVFADIVRIAST